MVGYLLDIFYGTLPLVDACFMPFAGPNLLCSPRQEIILNSLLDAPNNVVDAAFGGLT